MTGVVGAAVASWEVFSSVGGDGGRLATGVEGAVPSVAAFFVFFFRPTIGACTGSSSTSFTGASSLFVPFSASFALAWRSFFCWLFVVCLTGADPTLLGGGELALDIEVDVIETLSETISLTGVPRRDGCLSAVGDEAIAAIAGERMRGLSSFGVGNTRRVRGWTARGAGEPVRETVVPGVPGREIAP